MKQDSKQIRRFQSKFTAWQLGNRGFKRVTFGKPSSPGETTKLTVLQPGGVSFWLRFFCV